MKKIITAIVLLLSLYSCTESVTESTGSIYGTVVDKSTGEQIPVASISLNPSGKTTITGSDGTFEFRDIDPGEYTISAKKEGYNPGKNTVMVVAGKNSECHILMERIPAVVTADREELDFGVSVTTLAFSIVNSGYENLEWSVEYDKSLWIKEVKPSSGVLSSGKTAAIVVSIDRTKLKEGNNEMVIVIVSTNGKYEIRAKAVGEKRALPKLNVLDATNVTSKSATLNAKIIDVGAPAYTVRGFVYSLNEMPSFDNMISKFTTPVTDDAEFSYRVNGLTLGETYYVRAFATNEIGTEYSSNQISFTTKATKPEVTIDAVSNIDVTNASVVFNGTVNNVGDPAYTEKGFVYSLSSSPTTTDSKIVVGGTGEGIYNAKANNLQLDKTYYVRAYIINSQGIYYSSEEKIFKVATTLPKVSVDAVSNINVGEQTATLNGKIEEEGVPAYYERGFVYGLINNPTIQDTQVTATGSGIGEYSANISFLERNKTYYVRAYAINEGGINYSGEQVQFSLDISKASVSIKSATNPDIDNKSIVLNGTILTVGEPEYTERGFVYNKSGNPSILDDVVTVSGSGSGDYSVKVQGLELNTEYYAKAYVINEGGISYSDKQLSFSIKTTNPVVAMTSVTEINYSKASVTFNGEMSNVGVPSYTERGFVYGININPTINNNKEIASSSSNKFSTIVSNLKKDTKYYVRAYALQNGEAFYSSQECSFTIEATLPTVSELNISNINYESRSALFSANITSLGDPILSEKGFVYSTTTNPNFYDSKKITSVGPYTGEYSLTADNLSPGATYYVRAYAVNQAGVAYNSNEVVFTIKAILGKVKMTSISGIDLSAHTAVVRGEVTYIGDPAYSERGFVYSNINTTPTIHDSVVKVDGSDTGTFDAKLTGLAREVTYYVRAYIKNEAGVAYSENVMEFSTNESLAVVETLTATDIDEATHSAVLHGKITDVGTPTYTERGFVYSTEYEAPTVADTKVVVSGVGLGEFEARVSGFSAEAKTYIRAYVKNSKGISYGKAVTVFEPPFVNLPTAGIAVQQTDITGNKGAYWDDANRLCENSTVGGFTDWRLPTIDELMTMYSNRGFIGGFSVDSYWSSTPYGSDYWKISFYDGSSKYSSPHYTTDSARCVRTLTK